MVEFPAALEWVVGVDWPNGDERKMFALADGWNHAGTELKAITEQLDAVHRLMAKAYPQGVGSESILANYQNVRNYLDDLSGSYREVGKAAKATGADIEAAKIEMAIALVALAAELIASFASGPFKPLVDAGLIAATRVILGVLRRQLLALLTRNGAKALASRALQDLAKHAGMKLAEVAGKEGLKGLAKEGLKEAGKEIGQELLQTYGTKAYQVAAGHRDGSELTDWTNPKNLKELGLTIAGAGAGGLAGSLAGKGFAHLPGVDVNSKGLRGALTGFGTGAVAGGAGDAAAAVAPELLQHGVNFDQWKIDPKSIVGGAVSGGLPGGVRGARGMTPNFGNFDPQQHNDGSSAPSDRSSRGTDVATQPAAQSTGPQGQHGSPAPGASDAGSYQPSPREPGGTPTVPAASDPSVPSNPTPNPSLPAQPPAAPVEPLAGPSGPLAGPAEHSDPNVAPRDAPTKAPPEPASIGQHEGSTSGPARPDVSAGLAPQESTDPGSHPIAAAATQPTPTGFAENPTTSTPNIEHPATPGTAAASGTPVSPHTETTVPLPHSTESAPSATPAKVDALPNADLRPADADTHSAATTIASQGTTPTAPTPVSPAHASTTDAIPRNTPLATTTGTDLPRTPHAPATSGPTRATPPPTGPAPQGVSPWTAQPAAKPTLGAGLPQGSTGTPDHTRSMPVAANRITAAAVPGSDFHGHVADPSIAHVEQVHGRIDAALHSVTAGHGGLRVDAIDPGSGQYRFTDTTGRYSGDQRSFTVRVETQRLGDEIVARSILNHDKGQNVIQLSDRISTDHVRRALAHEIGEIVADRRRYLIDRLDAFGADEGILRPDGPTEDARLTPHDAGRIQELRVLGEDLAELPTHNRTPEQQAMYERLHREAMALVEHMGLRDGMAGAADRRALVLDQLSTSPPSSDQVRALFYDSAGHADLLSPADQQLLQDIRDQARVDQTRFDAHRAALQPDFERPVAFDGDRVSPAQARALADAATAERARRSEQTLAELRQQLAAAPGEYPTVRIDVGGGASLAARDPGALLVDDRGRWQSDNGQRIAQTADQLRNLNQTALGDPYQFVGEGRPSDRVPLDAVRYWEDSIAAQGPVIDGTATFRVADGTMLADITPADGSSPITVAVEGIPLVATGFPPEIIPGVVRGLGGMYGTYDSATRALGAIGTPGTAAAKTEIEALSWRDPASATKALDILAAHGIDRAALPDPVMHSLEAIDHWESLRERFPGRVISGDEANLIQVDPDAAAAWVVAGTGGTGISGVENLLTLSDHATFTMIGRNPPPGLADNTQWREVREQHDLGYDPSDPTAASKRNPDGTWPNPNATARLALVYDPGMNITGIEEHSGPSGTRFAIDGIEGDGIIAALGSRNSVPPAVADLIDHAIHADRDSVSARMLFDNDGQYLGYRISVDGHHIDVSGAASRFYPVGQLFEAGRGYADPLPASSQGTVWSTTDARYAAAARWTSGFAPQTASLRDAPPEGGNFDGGYVASAVQATHYAAWRRSDGPHTTDRSSQAHVWP
ncbi:hypothetical protein [Nocardia sp. NPDC049149]|uniref:WXG100-like domain-containing protein n=1 Tax=Nocardia sp. NPDC049149 TaxID=3364315 RepID=UPI00371C0F1C